MNKNIKIIAIVFLIGTTALSLYNFFRADKLAYVDTVEVYNNFNYKLELEEKLETTKEARKQVLDTLLSGIEWQVRYIESNKEDKNAILKYEYLREAYLKKEKQFKEDNEALTQKYTNQIWKQLNQYIKDFGKENKYRFIYGANGQGSLLYADDMDNVSKAMLTYVNSKYEGEK